MQQDIDKWIRDEKSSLAERVLNNKDWLQAYYEDNDESKFYMMDVRER